MDRDEGQIYEFCQIVVELEIAETISVVNHLDDSKLVFTDLKNLTSNVGDVHVVDITSDSDESRQFELSLDPIEVYNEVSVLILFVIVVEICVEKQIFAQLDQSLPVFVVET